MDDRSKHNQWAAQSLYTVLFDGVVIDQADKLVGRLNNMFYMANAIDTADGAESDQPFDERGTQQFEYMMSGERSDVEVYIRMRRMMREANLDGVRMALFLLIAVENGVLDGNAAALILDGEAGYTVLESDQASGKTTQDNLARRFISGPGVGKTYTVKRDEHKIKDDGPIFLENTRADDRSRHPRKPR